MKNATFICVLLFCLASLPVSGGDDVAVLLNGVESIGAPGVPGPLAVVGKDAFVVVAGRSGNFREPVVAAGRWGKGRVVAFGHNGYLSGGGIKAADTGRLLVNAARWMCGEEAGAKVLAVRCRTLGTHLASHAFEVTNCGPGDLPAKLPGSSLLCMDAAKFIGPTVRKAVRKFVMDGGGLLTAGLGWGWLQLHPGSDLRTQYPGNRLLAEAGIVWADGTLSRTTSDGYVVGEEPGPLLHGGVALRTLLGEKPMTALEVKRASAVVVRALRSLPPDDAHVLPLLKRHLGPGSVIRVRLRRVRTAWEVHRIPWDEPVKIRAHPSAGDFPGAVRADAPRVTRLIDVDHSVPDWQSTGLYAPPGESVIATLLRDDWTSGLRLRIGCHRDSLWKKEVWNRPPEISRSWPLQVGRTAAASPFGGLVYLVVPKGLAAGKTSVRIEGCVEAPWFVFGRTDPGEWKEKICKRPAPWAELGSKKVILTVPAHAARMIDDPVALLTFWDRVADACADLAGRPRERKRPERYVADIQISVGYMHAGYPIMTHLDGARVMTQLPILKGNGHYGCWGLYHEIGHNHQSRLWTFDGTVEVTVNLFTLYIMETLCGVTDGHRGVRKGAEAMREYIETGADFETWKRKPFLALTMYLQLKEAFGWEAFKKVFVEYRNLRRSERPISDDQKRDQWMVRFSRTVGRNLGPFFKAWGVPVSASALKSIEDLPAWMPEVFRPR